jgi:hypothetical protein
VRRCPRTGARARGARWPHVVVLLGALLAGCGEQPSTAGAAPAGGWQEFSGSLSAAGRRTVLHLGPQRRVAVVDATGSLLLDGPTRPAPGFQMQVLSFSDELTGTLGRAVWTDERGDQVYSELEGVREGDDIRITGRFVGGSGRYAGATGEYAFEWQYLIESESGQVQGRAVGFAGRMHTGAPAQDGPR